MFFPFSKSSILIPGEVRISEFNLVACPKWSIIVQMEYQTQSIFDIIGPIMVGPSSSHTAGVLKLAHMAAIIFQDPIEYSEITFYGSLAYTHKGHGSDKAAIAGILRMAMDDENIENSFTIALQKGLQYKFHTVYDPPDDFHPNTLGIILKNSQKKMLIQGASLGGGNIEIHNIDGYEVSLTGEFDSLMVWHHDEVGVIARVCAIMATHRINIASITSHRREKGEEALLVAQVDAQITTAILDEINLFEPIYRVLYVPRTASDNIQ